MERVRGSSPCNLGSSIREVHLAEAAQTALRWIGQEQGLYRPVYSDARRGRLNPYPRPQQAELSDGFPSVLAGSPGVRILRKLFGKRGPWDHRSILGRVTAVVQPKHHVLDLRVPFRLQPKRARYGDVVRPTRPMGDHRRRLRHPLGRTRRRHLRPRPPPPALTGGR